MSARAAARTLFFLGAAALAAGARASGRDGFQSLELLGGVRQRSMGGAAVAVADDANAAFWNPAALAFLRRDELSFQYMNYVQSMSYDGLAYAHPLARGAGVGFQAHVFDYGSFPSYDGSGLRSGATAAKDTFISAGYAKPLGDSLRAGVSVNQVREAIGGDQASAFAGDAGFVYLPAQEGIFSRLRLGGSWRHVGGGAAFIQEKTPLPQVWTVGAAYQSFSEAYTTAFDLESPRDGKSAFRLGQELWLNSQLALRAGLYSRDKFSSGWSAGFGARFRDFQVDYSFTAGAKGFDQAHRIGVTWRFGGAAEELYQEAVKLMQDGDYAEAILRLKKVLDADPRHRRAVARMKEAVRALRAEREEPPQ